MARTPGQRPGGMSVDRPPTGPARVTCLRGRRKSLYTRSHRFVASLSRATLLAAVALLFAACGSAAHRPATSWTVEIAGAAGGTAIALNADGLFSFERLDDGGTHLVHRGLSTGDRLWSRVVHGELDADALSGTRADASVVMAWTPDHVAWFSSTTGGPMGEASDLPCSAPGDVAASGERVVVRCDGIGVWTTSGHGWKQLAHEDDAFFAIAAHDGQLFALSTSTDDADVSLSVWAVTSDELGESPLWSAPLFDTIDNVEVVGGRLYGRLDDYTTSSRRVSDGRGVREILASPSGATHLGGWFVSRETRSGQVLHMQRIRAWEAADVEPTWTTWLPFASSDGVRASLDDRAVLVQAGPRAALLDRQTGETLWTVEASSSTGGTCVVLGASENGLVRRCMADDGLSVRVESIAPTPP